MADAWPLKSPMDVAEALDWLRRRMNGNGLVLVAISPNSIAFAKDPKLSAFDAVELLQLERETLLSGLGQLAGKRVTRDAAKRRG